MWQVRVAGVADWTTFGQNRTRCAAPRHCADPRMVRSRINLREFLGSTARTASRRRSPDVQHNPALQAFWDVIAMIPQGRVFTYGDVARIAGFPGRARQAGYALKHMPPGMHLPWHRVVGAGGRIAFPKLSGSFTEQVRRLQSEGVKVTAGRVDRSALLDV
jgi:methylated-DNA-protein-cysteine methyltransferase-like protein